MQIRVHPYDKNEKFLICLKRNHEKNYNFSFVPKWYFSDIDANRVVGRAYFGERFAGTYSWQPPL